jgi:hypothetical protein
VRALAWLAAGGICLFAVGGHLALLNFRVIGLILLVRGAVGLWMDLDQRGRACCQRLLTAVVASGTAAFESLTADLARDDAMSVPLADLLGPTDTKGTLQP